MPWTSQAGYEILIQGSTGGGGGYSCGLACVAMVVRAKTGTKPSERAVGQMSKGHSGAYQPGTAFRAGAIPVLPTATVSGGGTMMGNLSSILNDYRITNHYYPNGTWQQIVGAVRPGSPVIAHVNVGARGYGHFVVLHAFHPSAPKGLIILDPEYGLVADAAGNSFTNNRNDVATFSGHYITT